MSRLRSRRGKRRRRRREGDERGEETKGIVYRQVRIAVFRGVKNQTQTQERDLKGRESSFSLADIECAKMGRKKEEKGGEDLGGKKLGE